MSPVRPAVDINLFVYNGAATIAETIESIIAQTWPSLTLTVIDNGSTDATLDIVRGYASEISWIRIHRNRANVGAVANCQRAFWHGDADFVVPKTADDPIAPDYVERLMGVLLERPECVMCHAGALVFTGQGQVREVYPPEHRLLAIGDDPLERARHVMSRYTTAPSFWGVYRRAAVDRLLRIPYRSGWDHAVLAELALYGEIRHVPELLYWRRNGGGPVRRLARECTAFAQRGLPVDDALADIGWRTPLITTAFNHLEVFALARVAAALRPRLMALAVEVLPGAMAAAHASRSGCVSRRASLPHLRSWRTGWRGRGLDGAATDGGADRGRNDAAGRGFHPRAAGHCDPRGRTAWRRSGDDGWLGFRRRRAGRG